MSRLTFWFYFGNDGLYIFRVHWIYYDPTLCIFSLNLIGTIFNSTLANKFKGIYSPFLRGINRFCTSAILSWDQSLILSINQIFFFHLHIQHLLVDLQRHIDGCVDFIDGNIVPAIALLSYCTTTWCTPVIGSKYKSWVPSTVLMISPTFCYIFCQSVQILTKYFTYNILSGSVMSSLNLIWTGYWNRQWFRV